VVYWSRKEEENTTSDYLVGTEGRKIGRLDLIALALFPWPIFLPKINNASHRHRRQWKDEARTT